MIFKLTMVLVYTASHFGHKCSNWDVTMVFEYRSEGGVCWIEIQVQHGSEKVYWIKLRDKLMGFNILRFIIAETQD